MKDVATLVRKAQSGDVGAFTELVGRYQAMAFGYAYTTLGDFHLAEDAMQQAFVVAYGNLSSLDHPERFGGWLRGIVRFECLHLVRSKRQIMSLERATELASHEPGPAELAEDRDGFRWILAAINELPPAERETTVLYYIHDHSQREVADFLNLPVTTVNNRLRSARKRLKNERLLSMSRDALSEHMPSDTANRIGNVVRVLGPVVDVRFSPEHRPSVLSALTLAGDDSSNTLRLEVAQHLANDLVRCVVAPGRDQSSMPEPGTQLSGTGLEAQTPLEPAFLKQVISSMKRPVDKPAVLETGIKAIDLLAPFTADGIIGIAGDAGSGKMVLVEELIHRLAQSTGVLSLLVFVETSSEVSMIRNFEYRTSAAVEAIYLPVADASPEGLRDISQELDAIVVLSRDMAKAGLYPAIDPLASDSRLFGQSVVGDHHASVAEDVRRLLNRAQDEPNDASLKARSDQLRRYLAQPFFVAEPYTKLPGVTVPLAETIEECEALLRQKPVDLGPHA